MALHLLFSFVFLYLPIQTQTSPDATLWQGNFSEKSKPIEGEAKIVQKGQDRFLILGADFKTKSGPDLKLVFSPHSLGKLDGKTAMDGAFVLALLKQTKGLQEYKLPGDLEWDSYKSLLVHCEKYAVLWGGAALE